MFGSRFLLWPFWVVSVWSYPFTSENEEKVDLMNPEEMGEYAEGDMVVSVLSKNGLVDKKSRWPDGVVPYQIDSSVSNSVKSQILRAMEEYHKRTCIRFLISTIIFVRFGTISIW